MLDLSHSPARSGHALAISQLALASAQPLAAYVTKLTGRGVSEAERARAVDGPVSPAPGAFAIWLPLFATSIANGARMARAPERFSPAQLSRQQRAPLHRVAWLMNAAYACNSAWSLRAQLVGLGWPSVGIIVVGAASASAALIGAERLARTERLERGAEPPAPDGHDAPDRSPPAPLEATARGGAANEARAAADAIAPLAGWLTLATFANLEATLNETGGRPRPRHETHRALILLGSEGALAGAVAATSQNPLYTAALAWGLGGVVVRNLRGRNRTIAAAAGLGCCAAVAATIGLLRRRRSGATTQRSR